MRKAASVMFLGILLVSGFVFLYAQQFRGGFGNFFRQNNPPDTEFIMARWQFRGRGKFGGTGWTHNYPNSEEHMNQLLKEATLVNVDPASYRIVQLSSSEIFRYPFAYVSEPGEMWLTDEEVTNMREYVDRGGFVLFDDFDGDYDLNVLRRELKRAFPKKDLVPLTIENPILNSFYKIDGLNVMSPYQVGEPATFYSLQNDHGEVAMILCHNNDLANYWDWIDRPIYPLKPSAEAFRLGINFVIYSMTH
jgi:hypothetical protein